MTTPRHSCCRNPPVAFLFPLQTVQILADAILDRLTHNAHRIELKGESMRKIKAKLEDRKHAS